VIAEAIRGQDGDSPQRGPGRHNRSLGCHLVPAVHGARTPGRADGAPPLRRPAQGRLPCRACTALGCAAAHESALDDLRLPAPGANWRHARAAGSGHRRAGLHGGPGTISPHPRCTILAPIQGQALLTACTGGNSHPHSRAAPEGPARPVPALQGSSPRLKGQFFLVSGLEAALSVRRCRIPGRLRSLIRPGVRRFSRSPLRYFPAVLGP
jgi:hypothetical protein